MGRIAVAIDLDASPDLVWRVVEPIERHVEWMADAVAIRFETDQTRGVGTRFLCDTRFGPFRLTDRMAITEWLPGVAMGVAHIGVVTGTGRFTLTPLGSERTRFAWEEDLHFPWWLGGRFGEVIGGQLVVKAVWRRNLRCLAEQVATERARSR